MNHIPASRIIQTLIILISIFFIFETAPSAADEGQDINTLPPHPDLGIADINTDLEAAHDLAPPGLGYKFFDANYQQSLNLGVSWNRWKVDWTIVEQSEGVFTWSCRNEAANCAITAGRLFDYSKLAQEDEARGVNSLVILAEIPSFYQIDDPPNNPNPTNPNSLIKGIDEEVFLDISGVPTNDPAQADSINDANKWARFVYNAMEELGAFGVQHWQIMNESNADSYWSKISPINSSDYRFGPRTYVQALFVASKIIEYRNTGDLLITSGLFFKAPEKFEGLPNVPDNSSILNDWAEIMFEELDSGLVNFQIDVIALHPYDRSKTSYDFPILATDYFADTDPPLSNLQGIPIWLTETGSSDCSDDVFEILSPTNEVLVKCPPWSTGQSRSNEIQHADYMIQSMSYGFTVPEVEKYFQFHLHDFCPYGGAGGAQHRPGFGLYHNWPQFDFFGPINCAVHDWDGDERLAYHAFYQASRWLRDLQGYTVGLGENDPAENGGAGTN